MYTFDERFFNVIDSADKAYLLGFICTDGNLYKREKHQGQLQISVRDYDTEILEHFKTSLRANHPIQTTIDKRRPTTVMQTITFVSEPMYLDLKKLLINDNKTFSIDYTFIFNKINKIYWKSFLLGLFDGDGNIDYPKDGTISRSHVRLSGPLEQLKQIQQVLNTLKIPTIIVEDKRKYTKPFGSLECKNTIEKYCVLKYLYSDEVNCLSRKKENALELIRRIESNTTNRKENKDAIKYWHELGV